MSAKNKEIESVDAGIKGMEHIGIVTCNLDETVRFFRDLLGCRVLKSWRFEEKKINFVMLEAGGCRLELLSFDEGIRPDDSDNFPPKVSGLRHLCFNVDDLDKTKARLEASGVYFLTPIRSVQYYKRAAFCKGPENIVVELVEIQ